MKVDLRSISFLFFIFVKYIYMTKEKNVGTKIKNLREAQNISREELSRRSGLGETLLCAIEENQNIPSLSPLIKIARALGVRLGTFLDDADNMGPVVSRKGAAMESIITSNTKTASSSHLDFCSLADKKAGRHMEPFFINIQPAGEKNFILSSHEGEEFIYVLEGTVQITYGKEKIILNQGDSIYYDSIVDHLVHAGDDKGAKIVAVVYTPF